MVTVVTLVTHDDGVGLLLPSTLQQPVRRESHNPFINSMSVDDVPNFATDQCCGSVNISSGSAINYGSGFGSYLDIYLWPLKKLPICQIARYGSKSLTIIKYLSFLNKFFYL
jgi:hypothetical protein